MKEKPVLPLLVSMALPNVISMLVNSLYNIVDSLFVARISEDAMTALSLVFPIQNFANAIAIGFGIGINAMIALYLGAGDHKKAETAATHGMALSLMHGILITIVSIHYLFRCTGRPWQGRRIAGHLAVPLHRIHHAAGRCAVPFPWCQRRVACILDHRSAVRHRGLPGVPQGSWKVLSLLESAGRRRPSKIK